MIPHRLTCPCASTSCFSLLNMVNFRRRWRFSPLSESCISDFCFHVDLLAYVQYISHESSVARSIDGSQQEIDIVFCGPWMRAIKTSPTMRLRGFGCIQLIQAVHKFFAVPSLRPVFFLHPCILICLSAMGSAMYRAPQCGRYCKLLECCYAAPRRTVTPVTYLFLMRHGT